MKAEGWIDARTHRRQGELSVAFEGGDFERVKGALGARVEDAEDGEVALLGTYEGVDALAAVELRGGEVLRMHACVARVDPPLLLGVAGRSSGARTRFDEWFDAPVDPRTPELIERANAAMKAGELAHALRRARLVAHVSDTLAIVEEEGPSGAGAAVGYVGPLGMSSGTAGVAVGAAIAAGFSDPGAAVDAPLEIAVALARALGKAREELPRSESEEALLASWTAAADGSGLTVDATRFALGGLHRGQQVSLRLTTLARHVVTVLRVALDRATSVGLRIFEATTASRFKRFFRVMQDISVGDREFDARFVVQGTSADAVRAVVGAELPRRIMSVVETHGKTLRSLSVHDGMLEVILEGMLDDRDALAALLDDAAEAARAVAGPDGPISAYRD
jgi:hypothetical protein